MGARARKKLATVSYCAPLAILSIAPPQAFAAPDDADEALRHCRALADPHMRLACYDRAATRFAPPRFAGKRSQTTETFTIERPHWLRYHSDGVIFVLYLRDANGDVVQNLHLGGGGEDSYLITKPGTYYLQVDGSESWRIWLEPAKPKTSTPSNRQG